MIEPSKNKWFKELAPIIKLLYKDPDKDRVAPLCQYLHDSYLLRERVKEFEIPLKLLKGRNVKQNDSFYWDYSAAFSLWLSPLKGYPPITKVFQKDQNKERMSYLCQQIRNWDLVTNGDFRDFPTPTKLLKNWKWKKEDSLYWDYLAALSLWLSPFQRFTQLVDVLTRDPNKKRVSYLCQITRDWLITNQGNFRDFPAPESLLAKWEWDESPSLHEEYMNGLLLWLRSVQMPPTSPSTREGSHAPQTRRLPPRF